MKHAILLALCAIILPFMASGQDSFVTEGQSTAVDVKDLPAPGGYKNRGRAESNFSLSLNVSALPDMRIAYEQRATDRFTIIFAVGLQAFYVAGSGHFSSGFYGPNLFCSLEPRVYLNLSKRAQQGKSTYRNSGSFLAMELHRIGMSIGGSTGGVSIASQTLLSPVFGLRRARGNFLFEMKAGIDLNLTEALGNTPRGAVMTKDQIWNLHLGFRFGLVF